MTPAHTHGEMLREWRLRRRMSQLDLANIADISTKHLSFLETGRSRPSRQMLLHLAACLDVPLRERNALLTAAGYPPVFAQRTLSEPALSMVRQSVEGLLHAHAVNPAMAVDRYWNMVASNQAMSRLLNGVEAVLLRPPVNLFRLILHPAGLAPRVVNLVQWRGLALGRLRQRLDEIGDPALMDLLEEIQAYPIVRGHECPQPQRDTAATPLQIATLDGVLSFFSTATVFSMPVDITVSELAIEAFLPADAETAVAMRRIADQTDEEEEERSSATWVGIPLPRFIMPERRAANG